VPEVLMYVLAVVAFVGIYVLLRERHARGTGERAPVQWGWLAAIFGLAAVAVIVGVLLG
jgi:hypothetical protein